jgi:hypothetical protein
MKWLDDTVKCFAKVLVGYSILMCLTKLVGVITQSDYILHTLTPRAIEVCVIASLIFTVLFFIRLLFERRK